jgi:DNA-binding transcriptional MerR regulator
VAIATGAMPMQIGQLARQAGTPIDTVRCYGRHGLLSAPSRRASGYREFTDGDLRRLRFVQRAKALGFTLTQIRELELSARPDHDMAAMKPAATGKLADVESRSAELTRICDGLRALMASCPGHGELGQCPILNALAGDAP